MDPVRRWPPATGAMLALLLLAAGCHEEREVRTRVHLEVLDAHGQRIAASRVGFVARGVQVAAGEIRNSEFLPSGPPPRGDWGRSVDRVVVEAPGFERIEGETDVERVVSRRGTGGHPSIGSILVETFEVRARVLAAPRLDSEEARFLRFALTSPDRSERTRAAVMLGGFGPPEGRAQEKRRVAGALAALDFRAPESDDFEAWLADALRPPDDLAQRAASLVVAEYPAERQREALLRAENRSCGPRGGHAELVLVADLNRVADREDARSEFLARALASPDPACRGRAARGLSWTGGRFTEGVRAALATATEDVDPATRWTAALTLASRGDGRPYGDRLREALEAPSPFVRTAAALALVRDLRVEAASEPLVAALVATVEDPRRSTQDRSGALWALSRLDHLPAEAAAILARSRRDDDDARP